MTSVGRIQVPTNFRKAITQHVSDMAIPRGFHACISLGHCVFVIGGLDQTGLPMNDFESYNHVS
jgi:DNA-binding transcriptional regulator/RsmH inhibitor MraZ